MQMASKDDRASILLLGNDPLLLETRAWMLERVGFRLNTTLDLDVLDQIASAQQIDLFLICDSFLPAMRRNALEVIESKWPGTKRLLFQRAGDPIDVAVTATIIPAIEGPRTY